MDDLIYRQQAIDAVQGIGRLATLPDNDAVVRMSAVEYVLFNLPPAQPKQGHWIEHKYAEEVNEMLISNYECSECHYWERYDSNFCPECGAKMEEVKECVNR